MKSWATDWVKADNHDTSWLWSKPLYTVRARKISKVWVCSHQVAIPKAISVPMLFLTCTVCAFIIHKCWVCSGPPVQGLFKRFIFWGNQRHGKKETALLSDITSSCFWWPKWPLDKGSLSVTLPCAILSLRGIDGGYRSVINMDLWY